MKANTVMKPPPLIIHLIFNSFKAKHRLISNGFSPKIELFVANAVLLWFPILLACDLMDFHDWRT